MSEVFPISCISCRRKKIKCNKVRPCNQCEKRQICCNFPSTFRNIKINEDELDNLASGHSSSNVSVENSNSESDYMGNQLVNSRSRKLLTLAEEVDYLKTEKSSISEEHNKLKKNTSCYSPS